MKEFYIQSIEAKKRGHKELYENILLKLFGQKLSWKEVKELENDKLAELTLELDHTIKIEESPFDIKKLASAIQRSRSGAGGCAITEYKCALCGKTESWGNTATPNICRECAEKMATNIVLCKMNLFKNK